MSYLKQIWRDLVSGGTTLTADRLNHMEDGIAAANDAWDSVSHVVAEGMDGIWTWRKWSSGIAECWGLAEFSDGGAWPKSWGEIYSSSDPETPPAYPSGLFASTPVCTMTPHGTQNYQYWIIPVDMPTKDRPPAIEFLRGSSPASGAPTWYQYVAIEAKGRWM